MNDDFKNIALYFNSLVKELKEDVPRDLTTLAGQILADLQAGDFKDRTGALRSSMTAYVQDYSIVIQMLNYGYFVSFGVEGGNHTAMGLTPEVQNYFGVEKFESRERPNWGISPRRFYPTDIQERILEILEIVD